MFEKSWSWLTHGYSLTIAVASWWLCLKTRVNRGNRDIKYDLCIKKAYLKSKKQNKSKNTDVNVKLKVKKKKKKTAGN